MKPGCGIFVMIFLLSFRIAWGQKEINSVLDKKITIEITNEPIISILDKISLQTKVFFSYDASLIEADKITNLSVTDKTIQESLDSLFASRFVYKTIGDQIIIALPEVAQNDEDQLADSKKKLLVIAFKGRVFDSEEKVVLPFANVSILRSNIGTLSNSDGDFVLKIPATMQNDTIIVSCLGYRQYRIPVSEIGEEKYNIDLVPTSFQLKEIKVTGINPQEILGRILSKINLNYPQHSEIMTAFYREVLKQDSKYIDVAEAVMEIKKAMYGNEYDEDKVKCVKGRKNDNVQPFKFVDFKIQGGPYYITKLDVIKTLDSFLDPEFREFYKYSLDDIVELDNRTMYVVGFKPREKVDYPCYQGNLFVDMSTFALVQADFSLSRSGLKFAQSSLIKKKPKDFYVRPIDVSYKVSYRRSENQWHLNHAQASIKFKVKSKSDRVNSTFHSISDLLITDIKPDDGTHFKRDELFNPKDIFTEIITNYDEGFWGNYNTIKPSEELRNALQKYSLENDTLFNVNEKENRVLNNNNTPK
jgi:hypothetical protein